MEYSAQIEHSEETFKRLARIQYDAYCVPTKLMLAALGAVCVYLGMTMTGSAFSMVLLFLGCWTIISIQLPAKRNAEKMIAMAKGDFPVTQYRFWTDHIQISGEQTSAELNYTQIYDLLEDREYLYLFLNRTSGYMIPKDSVSPCIEDFILFLEKKTGKKKSSVKGLLSLNLSALLHHKK